MKNITLIRLLRDYNQLKVQMDTTICQQAISKYETGKTIPTGENLIILAKYYNVSTDFLLDLTDEQTPYPPKKKNWFSFTMA